MNNVHSPKLVAIWYVGAKEFTFIKVEIAASKVHKLLQEDDPSRLTDISFRYRNAKHVFSYADFEAKRMVQEQPSSMVSPMRLQLQLESKR